MYARINSLGFIETPYRDVKGGKVDLSKDGTHYMTAEEEESKLVSLANVEMDDDGNIKADRIQCRYAADFPVLALLSGASTAENVRQFTEGLVKALVPPSLYYAKHVYQGRALLLDLLKSMWNGEFGSGASVVDWCGKRWTFGGQTLPQLFSASLENPIAWNVKWKNLLCRLVEYRASAEKDDALFRRLFETGFDIEHVQSFTDEKDYERVWKEWGDELNRVGNLAMLESGLNRSIRNQRARKPEAYAASEYRSIRELGAKVATWTKDNAIARRNAIARDLGQWLASPAKSEQSNQEK